MPRYLFLEIFGLSLTAPSFILQEKAKNDKIYAVHPQKSAGGERA
jgi:hypothetical protein